MTQDIEAAQLHKKQLRSRALSRRDELTTEQRTEAARAVGLQALEIEWWPDIVVAGYSPANSELDPLALMQAFAEKGAVLALPVIVDRDMPLVFRAWTPSEGLVRGSFGIFQPSSDAREIEPDVVLAPLAAFDRAGHRIGYGGGYYDRTLQELRATRRITVIGVAFAVQEIEIVPTLPHDQRLDYVITEREFIDLRSV